VDDLAADQMTTLLDQSDRFDVIERTQLTKLLDEQNLEGIVKPGELARPGQVRGVDYLLLGRVTNLRVKQESHDNSFGLAQVGGLLGGADVKHKDVSIKTECASTSAWSIRPPAAHDVQLQRVQPNRLGQLHGRGYFGRQRQRGREPNSARTTRARSCEWHWMMR
jgi:hypothetical protein